MPMKKKLKEFQNSETVIGINNVRTTSNTPYELTMNFRHKDMAPAIQRVICNLVALKVLDKHFCPCSHLN
jgi:hypothetical protein